MKNKKKKSASQTMAFTQVKKDGMTISKQNQDVKTNKIAEVELSYIDDFPGHPFHVKIDNDMTQLVESIQEIGLICPVIVRQKEDKRYEMVSGHRRKKACELAGFQTIKAEIRQLTRDEAIILMVESNLQRSIILPSEKAFSYKMHLDAKKRQVGRIPRGNYSPLGNSFEQPTSVEEMALEVGESKNTIFRYIRLTSLLPELLTLVDDGRIAFRPAVELSYLNVQEQAILYEEICFNDKTPSLSQAIKMKKLSKDHKLTRNSIKTIMSEIKPNQQEKVVFSYSDIKKFIPDNISREKIGEYILTVLKDYITK